MRQVTKDSTNISVEVYIIDSTDGTPETGVVFNTSGIDLEYRREGAVAVNITEADLATPLLTDAWADGGFLHIGHGYYRLDVPDAAFATGVKTVSIQGTVTGMIVLPQTIQLVAFDTEDAVRMGLTALPNAAADAIGGLPISDAGGLDLDAQLAATNEVTAARMGALTDWIDGNRLDLLLDAIPTTAMRGTDNVVLAGPTKAEMDTAHGLLATVADLLDKVGAVDEAAAAGDPSATESVMQYVKQLVNLLAGAAGIGTMPAAAAPANAVNMFEMVRSIYDDTNELQVDWVDAGRLDAILDAVLAMLDDARAEPGQGAPPVNPDAMTKIDYLYKAWRNKRDNDGSTTQIYADDGSTVDHKQTTSEAAGTVTKAEIVTGA